MFVLFVCSILVPTEKLKSEVALGEVIPIYNRTTTKVTILLCRCSLFCNFFQEKTKKRSFLLENSFFVPRIGLEPTRLSALAPETSASTISPSGLCDCKGNEIFTKCNFVGLFLKSFPFSVSHFPFLFVYLLG